MPLYLALAAASCLLCALCAGCVLAREPERTANRLNALVFLAVAFWAMCEVCWNLATDAATAVRLIRLSAPGWMFLGPLVLHVAVSAIQSPPRLVVKLVPFLYAASGVWVAIAWSTDWVTREAVRTSWGWGYRTGPAFPWFYAYLMAAVVPGLFFLAREFHSNLSPSERRIVPWLAVGSGAPLVCATLTDVALPILGIQVPHLGTTSFTVMGGTVMYTLWRFGYSFLTPGSFADEILSALPEGIALLQSDERIRTANAGFAVLSGHEPDRLVGMSAGELLAPTGDESSPTRPGNDLLARSAAEEVECVLLRATGDRIPVSISSTLLRDRHFFPIGVVLVVRDLREVTDLRRELVTSARLAAVGELAAGIAHEINNPIAFVRTNLSQLQSHWKSIRSELEPEKGRGDLGEILVDGDEMIEESIEGVNRAAEIVRGVQGFSHRGSDERETADINLLLENVLHMAATQLRGHATVERYYADIPPVHCAPQELKQVFMNLMMNAGHAVDEGGVIRIRTETRGDYVAVTVEDDGCGIEPHVLERIFDPFFTTKRVGEGTGLGLGIAYQIVRSHGGDISVSSIPGEGTAFRVLLPLAWE